MPGRSLHSENLLALDLRRPPHDPGAALGAERLQVVATPHRLAQRGEAKRSLPRGLARMEGPPKWVYGIRLFSGSPKMEVFFLAFL